MELFLILAIIFLVIFSFTKVNYNMISIYSETTKKYYKVRNDKRTDEAVKILERVDLVFTSLIDEFTKNTQKYDSIKLNGGITAANIFEDFKKRKDSIIIQEKPYYSTGSSSTHRKQLLFLCLRDEEGNFHNENLIMYVALHELAHIICPEYGHTQLFKEIFYLVVKEAINKGYYKIVDYSKEPQEYCGTTVKTSIV